MFIKYCMNGHVLNRDKQNNIPNLQATSASPMNPTSHTQTIVRNGSESITEQVA